MLRYDPNGYLIPDDVILTDFKTFQSEFVDAVSEGNRLEIFNNFTQFCREILHDFELQQIVIFLNGRFTNKKQKPNDLDLVIFISFEDSQKHSQLIESKYDHDALKRDNRLDVFFLIEYPENHKNHAFTKSDRVYWVNQFTRTRPNRRGTIYKKGLLQITLTAHDVKQI